MKYPIYALFIFIALLSAPLFAELPSVTIRPVETAPKIDGVLLDECWKKADSIYKFTQDFPCKPARTQTQVQLAYDDKYLYIAVKVIDPALKLLKAEVKEFDKGKIFNGDCIEIFIAPEINPQRYFHITINPNGYYTDILHYVGELKAMRRWSSKTVAASGRSERSWTVEAAVPLARVALSDVIHRTWRFNITRSVPKKKEMKSESSQWAYTGGNSHKPWLFGVVRGPQGPQFNCPDVWHFQNKKMVCRGMAAVVKGIDCFLRGCYEYKGFLPENVEVKGELDDCRNMILAQHPSKADGFLRFYQKTGMEEYRLMAEKILLKLCRMMEETKDKDGKSWIHWGNVLTRDGKIYGYSKGSGFRNTGRLPHEFDQSRVTFHVEGQPYVDAFGLGFYGLSQVEEAMSPEIRKKTIDLLECLLDFYHRDYVLKDDGKSYYWRTDSFRPLNPRMPIPGPKWRKLGSDVVYMILAYDNMKGKESTKYINSLKKFARFYTSRRRKLYENVKDQSRENQRRALWRMHFLDSRMMEAALHLKKHHNDSMLLDWMHANLKDLPRYTRLPRVEFMMDGHMTWGESSIPRLRMFAELNPELFRQFLDEIVNYNLFPMGICTSGHIAEPVNQSAFPPLLDFSYTGWKSGALDGRRLNSVVEKVYTIFGHPRLVRDTEDWVRDVHWNDKKEPDWRATPIHGYVENVLGEGYYKNARTQAYILNCGFFPAKKTRYYSDKTKREYKNTYYQFTAPFQNHAEPFQYGRAHSFNLINTTQANAVTNAEHEKTAAHIQDNTLELPIQFPNIPRGVTCWGVLNITGILYKNHNYSDPTDLEIKSVRCGKRNLDFETYEMLEYKKIDSPGDKAVLVFTAEADKPESKTTITLILRKKETAYFRK